MKLNEFLPFTIARNTKQMVNDIRDNGQQVAQQVGNRTGFLDRFRQRLKPQTHYQTWMSEAAIRRQQARDRYNQYRGH